MGRRRVSVHLSNWGSHATPGRHGPVRKLSIMALPRAWERGEGSVPLLTPDAADVVDARHGRLDPAAYRVRFYRLVAFRVRKKGLGLAPGTLLTASGEPVVDGDTLLCACGAEKARGRRCHRVLAADLLAVAGWSVDLDGVRVNPDEAKARIRSEASVEPDVLEADDGPDLEVGRGDRVDDGPFVPWIVEELDESDPPEG